MILYQRKGNLPGVRESLGYLMHYAKNIIEGIRSSMPNSEVSEIKFGG